MTLHVFDVEDAQGDLVDILYFCSEGCWRDATARGFIAPDGPGAYPGGYPDFEDGCAVWCAECGVRLTGPDVPIVVNLIGREYGPDGMAVPVLDDAWIAREEC